MNASRAANRVEVTLGGKGVTSRAGLVEVAELADRLGLTKAMSAAMSPIVKRRRRRDPGVALAHVALLLADGGDCLSDLAVLRDEPDLFGTVASDSTALRALESGWAAEAIIDARRVARDAAWTAGAAPETITLELDATLLDAHWTKKTPRPPTRAASASTRCARSSTTHARTSASGRRSSTSSSTLSATDRCQTSGMR